MCKRTLSWSCPGFDSSYKSSMSQCIQSSLPLGVRIDHGGTMVFIRQKGYFTLLGLKILSGFLDVTIWICLQPGVENPYLHLFPLMTYYIGPI